MALDRAALDKARALNSLPPLTDAEFASLEGNGLSEAEKEAQLKAQQEEDKKKKESAGGDNYTDPTPEKELDDEALLELLAKKTGRKFSSLEELVPQEIIDKEKAAEERENEKFAWGLKNKKFKQKDFESYVSASKDPKGLVYQLRLQQAKKDDPQLDEKEFEEEFNEEFGINADKNTRRYKNGQDTLNRLAEAVLKNNYSNIFNLENEYSDYEKSQIVRREQENKIKSEAPKYKKSLDKVIGELKKIKAQIKDGEEYEIEALDESLNTIRDNMSDPAWVSQQILNGYTEENLKEIAYTTFLRQNFPFLANEILKQGLRKHAAGTKGILQLEKRAGETDDSSLTDQQKVLKSLIEQNKPQPATAN